MEASIEHLSRGTVRHVEVLLVVAEPYYRALETLKRTVPLARELNIPRVYVVANKVRSSTDETAIQEFSVRAGVEVIGAIPFDEAVQEADRQNRALVEYMPTAPSVLAIRQIVGRLTEMTDQSARAATSGGG